MDSPGISLTLNYFGQPDGFDGTRQRAYTGHMRNEFLNLLTTGEYQHEVSTAPLVMTHTRGLWRGEQIITLPGYETIHGNPVKVQFSWLQVGATGRAVAEEMRVCAHGHTARVDGSQFWEEMRKHI